VLTSTQFDRNISPLCSGKRHSAPFGPVTLREPDTLDPRQFGPKTLRHWLGRSKLSGHFGTTAEVSKRQFGPKCWTVSPYGPKWLTPRTEWSCHFWVKLTVYHYFKRHEVRPAQRYLARLRAHVHNINTGKINFASARNIKHTLWLVAKHFNSKMNFKCMHFYVLYA